MSHVLPASPDRRLSQHLLCFASAFAWTKADLRRWRRAGMAEMPAPLKEGDGRFLVDQYVPAFRDVVFFDDPQGEKSAKRFRTTWEPRAFESLRRPRNETPVPVTGRGVAGELYAFPSGLGIFVVEVDLGPGTTLDALSTAGDTLRSFESELVWQDGKREPFAHFIRDRVLGGVEIRGDTVDIDEYSGSKLKTFVVGDLGADAPRDLQRALLYDLGCFVPVGSAGGALRFSPTPEYLEATLGNAVSVFDQWSALGLADAFVAVGTGLLGSGSGSGLGLLGGSSGPLRVGTPEDHTAVLLLVRRAVNLDDDSCADLCGGGVGRGWISSAQLARRTHPVPRQHGLGVGLGKVPAVALKLGASGLLPRRGRLGLGGTPLGGTRDGAHAHTSANQHRYAPAGGIHHSRVRWIGSRGR
jgi:hypothetical protein